MSICASHATRIESRRWRPAIAGLLLGFFAALCPFPALHAYETDPFTNRLVPITDAAPELNAQVNLAISDIASHWKGPITEKRFVTAVYHRIGGHGWVDHLESWAMKNPDVEKLPTPRWHSFYRTLPLYASRVSGLFGAGPTLRIGDVLVGTDKIGHFLSQGRKFWRRWKRSGDEAQAAEHSAYTERAIFGSFTTGTYSNADLVANYEGYRFYRSLFEDDVVPGKKAILRLEDGRWIVQREFDWNDHVNAYWDEGLDINDYDRLMTPPVTRELHVYCDDWASAPERYTIDLDEEARLQAKYAMLQLKPRPELRLAVICAAPMPAPAPESEPESAPETTTETASG
jgi:hypothetical protein